MPQPIRRIVTGVNDNGDSIISIEDNAPNILESPAWPGSRLTEIWVTNEMPIDNSGSEDRAARPIQHDPTPNGSIFRVVEIPPESVGKIDTEGVFKDLGSTHIPTEKDSAKHASMHATNSVDYITVISGEMHMIMEEGEILLTPGDCIVQRGTKHAWSNRGNVPCVISVVLIDAHPVAA